MTALPVELASAESVILHYQPSWPYWRPFPSDWPDSCAALTTSPSGAVHAQESGQSLGKGRGSLWGCGSVVQNHVLRRDKLDGERRDTAPCSP